MNKSTNAELTIAVYTILQALNGTVFFQNDQEKSEQICKNMKEIKSLIEGNKE